MCPFLRLFVYFGWNHSTLFVLLMPCRADSFATGHARRRPVENPGLSPLAGCSTDSGLTQRWPFCSSGLLLLRNGHRLTEDVLAATLKLQWLAVFFACLISDGLGRRATGKVAGTDALELSARDGSALSYCIYLIHLSVLAGCFAFFQHSYPTMDTAASFGTLAIAALLTYALASVSWRFLERPMLKSRACVQILVLHRTQWFKTAAIITGPLLSKKLTPCEARNASLCSDWGNPQRPC